MTASFTPTAPKHEAIVKVFPARLGKGDIYQSQQQAGTASPAKNLKKSANFDGHRCSIHTNKQAEWRDEQNYFSG